MLTLRGIFPAPQKEPKKNFIKENVKQLRLLQCNRQNNENKRQVGNRGEPHHVNFPTTGANLPSNKCHKSNPQLNKMSSYNLNPMPYSGQYVHQKNIPKIRKANMVEFLKKKQLRENHSRHPTANNIDNDWQKHSNTCTTDHISQSKDASSQYIDPDTTHFLSDGARLRVIYPSKKIVDEIRRNQASGTDNCEDVQTSVEYFEKPKEIQTPTRVVSSRYMSQNNLTEIDKINKLSISSPKKTDASHQAREEKPNPLMAPPTYRKGVVPKYIQERKEQLREAASVEVDDNCPPGHMSLPENERIETLEILKNKFAELVNELNKMPVRTDTLRMRNRKMQLDKELEKLEEGIKVFSRPKVHIKL